MRRIKIDVLDNITAKQVMQLHEGETITNKDQPQTLADLLNTVWAKRMGETFVNIHTGKVYQLVPQPSNLGKGVRWYFLHDGKKYDKVYCYGRELYTLGELKRKGAIYTHQNYSRKWRTIEAARYHWRRVNELEGVRSKTYKGVATLKQQWADYHAELGYNYDRESLKTII